MAKNLLNKYVWLVETIYKAKKITFEEINEKWVPDVLCQQSEVVLWNLLSIQCSFDEFVGRKWSFCSISPPP